MKKYFLSILIFVFALSLSAQENPVELEFMFYCDRLECDVMRGLLDRFEGENPDIVVNMEIVPYTTIDGELPTMVAEGNAPDMARITNLGGYRGLLLDMRPYLDEATATLWEESFSEQTLANMRSEEGDALHGFPDSLTITGPFVNRTMFEGAGVPLPNEVSDRPTWDDWTNAAAEVAAYWSTEDNPIWAIAIDRSGHRVAGLAMSMGADFFDDDNNFVMDTEGFRAAADLIKRWHDEELTPPNVWLDSGTGYAAAADYFAQGQVVMYMSGSWQLGRFADDASINFVWEVVPNPYGAGGSTGIAGGAGIVAYADTEHPEEVARVMSFLVNTETYVEYSALSLQLPAHSAVAEQGVPYQTTNSLLFDGLMVFNAESRKLQDQAIALNVHPFAFAYYRNSANRITQYITGELTLDEMIEALQGDIDTAVAEAEGS